LIALTLLIAGILVAWFVQWLVRRALRFRRADPELSLFFARVVQWTIIVLAILLAAGRIGIDITAALAGLGIIGFTIGFALQDVSKNFVAGMLLLLQQPFEFGDAIQVSGYSGVVLDINLRDTVLRTPDGLRVRIPNGDIFTKPVTNYTKMNRRRIEITLRVPYDTDLEKLRAAAIDIVSKIAGVSPEPPPEVYFTAFGDYGIQMLIWYWFKRKETSLDKALDAGVTGLKKEFDKLGIRIPTPTYQLQSGDGARQLADIKNTQPETPNRAKA
jgi:small conductance mechanosensitive channel